LRSAASGAAVSWARLSGLAYTASRCSEAKYVVSRTAWAWPSSDNSGSAGLSSSSRRTGRACRTSKSSIG